MNAASLRIAWIDRYNLTRECFISAFVALYPLLVVVPYSGIRECTDVIDTEDLQVIVYHSHSLGADLCADLAALSHACGKRPIVLLSDADEANQLSTIRAAIKNGVKGYVCTRTTSVSVALASLYFVQAGGTFVPLESFLTPDRDATWNEEPGVTHRLTERQMIVLAQIRLGKPNKAIAEELNMSENAVKVHIRNIMRKMGAKAHTKAIVNAVGLPAYETDPLGGFVTKEGFTDLGV